jgi:tetratricopeptide (TPR) repeat protein
LLAEYKGEDFSRKVAVKLVKRGMDTSLVLKRFLMERQILAGLEHPNIARLIDGGSTSDGLPYFVMEYVDGENIREYCARRDVGYRERLELFLKVGDAVSYAHQKLVVHRDIKPSNILVTETGEPKLLDFGVAKLFGPDWNDSTTGATLTKLRMMTPEYASPEQFRGQTTTTATDVYSLGIVLYELLTGRRPFDFRENSAGDSGILTDEPLRPSIAVKTSGRPTADGDKRPTKSEKSGRLNAGTLKGDLDNIILKAIRREASERYRSVDEFCEDIRRYLNGLPVRATADSRRYRLRKFVGRHRAVSVMAVFVMMLTVASVWFAVRAVRERARAEERFRQVRKLANAVIFDYQDGVRPLAGSTAVRERMVNDGAAYLDGLAAENSDDPELQIELARAYDRLGDVKGSFFTPSLGNSVAAREFYNKALAIKRGLSAKSPGNTLYAEEVAETFDKLADAEFGNGNQTAAVGYYRQSIEIREKILAESRADQNIRYRLAKSYRNLGVRGRNKENTDESIGLCRKAIGMIDELIVELPERVDFEESRADFLEGIPVIIETNVERRAEAIAGYREVVEIRRALAEKYPQNALLRQKLGMTYSYLGDTFYELSKRPEAVVEYRQALAILDPLAVRDPLNGQLKQDIAAVRGSFAFTLAELGDTKESFDAFSSVVESFEKKLAADPDDSTTHFRLAMAKEGLAKTLRNIAKLSATPAAEKVKSNETALRLFEESLAIYKQYQAGRETFPSANVDVDQAVREVEQAIIECRTALGRS